MLLFARTIATVTAVALGLGISAAPADLFMLGRQLKSFEEERQIARSHHSAIVAQYGGEHENPELAAFADHAGQRFAASSD